MNLFIVSRFVGDFVIKEKAIKAALIDWLYAKGMVRDAVVINEMVVANWARRADIALANGRLYGFEIKSAFDSLKRLPGQIESFRCHFDKVTVVAASKFIADITESYPSEVGVIEVYLKSDKVAFRQVRAGRIDEVKNSQYLASLITRVEIERLLRAEGISFKVGATRKELLQYVDLIAIKKMRSFALSCIKERYRKTFIAFDKAREANGSLESLSLLSRGESLRAVLSLSQEIPQSYFRAAGGEYERSVDTSVLGHEFGAIPEDMPQTVLVRRRSQIRSS
ncbi:MULTISPECIES: sce7726 family protein [Pseudomonas]|uniref:sce7726 family protein n=1 Tax=Pseudomonas TaxID=286 RepID=UPI0014042DC5|nr:MULTISPECIES: sce7726 family protein [Pseudomonas]MBJ2345547.1 sce7726 family protein [Pseudomonas canavaninivorans]MBL3544689.1 sce7726 family protein [Pseudomonas sp. HB05]NHN67410.1 sce7726 family protein [Pseudomonas fluorescens]